VITASNIGAMSSKYLRNVGQYLLDTRRNIPEDSHLKDNDDLKAVLLFKENIKLKSKRVNHGLILFSSYERYVNCITAHGDKVSGNVTLYGWHH
jgi:hypothetical protein